MRFLALSSTLALSSKRLGMDSDSGEWCLQVKVISIRLCCRGREGNRETLGGDQFQITHWTQSGKLWTIT